MSEKTASYRIPPLLLAAVFTVACSSYLYLAPPLTDGRMAGVLRTTDGLTIVGWLAFACSIAITGLALTYAGRALVGLPALKSDGKILSVYVFPFRRIPLSEIDRVVLNSHDVVVHLHDGKRRKNNIRLAKQPDEFFRGLGLRVSS